MCLYYTSNAPLEEAFLMIVLEETEKVNFAKSVFWTYINNWTPARNEIIVFHDFLIGKTKLQLTECLNC